MYCSIRLKCDSGTGRLIDYIGDQQSSSLARKGLVLMGALAAVACAVTFPGLADLVFTLGLEVLMYVIVECVRERVALRVP